MVETEVPELDPEVWHELCPACGHTDPILEGGCTLCWDTQLIPHDGCEIE